MSEKEMINYIKDRVEKIDDKIENKFNALNAKIDKLKEKEDKRTGGIWVISTMVTMFINIVAFFLKGDK